MAEWLRTVVRQPKDGSRLVFPEKKIAATDPDKAERKRLNKVIDGAQSKISRLTDAYSDGLLDLAEFRLRREQAQADTAQAVARLAQLNEPAVEPPTRDELIGFAQRWASTSVEERREVLQSLLSKVLVQPDKTLLLIPRWGQPVLAAFSKRGTVPEIVSDAVIPS